MPELAASRWLPLTWPRARLRHWLGLIVIVVLVHMAALDRLVDDRFGWGSGEHSPPRIEVTFVRELAQAAPPPVAPAPPATRARRRAVAAAPPASAPLAETPTETLPPSEAPAPSPQQEDADAAPALPPDPVAAPADITPPPLAAASEAAATALAAAAAAAASAPAPPVSAAAASAPGFDWPPSTRLSYRLEGNYRGRIEGSATVEWLRSGNRYQVHLETALGPVLSRRITSDGELTDHGLAPRRFDGEQKVLFRGIKRWTQRFGPERITLADGSEVDAIAGAQDEASQFVQLTWLFTNQPELLQVGRALVVPLALNRRVDKWIYDVVGQERLFLPFGAVDTFHVKPRREAPGGDITPQMWFAPTLQYLPVRIRLSQADGSYIDLKLESPPLQAER